MLKFYFSTVAIYAIIILSAARMMKDKIRENGWLDGVKKTDESKMTALFMVSAVPVFRLLMVLAIFAMASTEKPKEKL